MFVCTEFEPVFSCKQLCCKDKYFKRCQNERKWFLFGASIHLVVESLCNQSGMDSLQLLWQKSRKRWFSSEVFRALATASASIRIAKELNILFANSLYSFPGLFSPCLPGAWDPHSVFCSSTLLSPPLQCLSHTGYSILSPPAMVKVSLKPVIGR